MKKYIYSILMLVMAAGVWATNGIAEEEIASPALVDDEVTTVVASKLTVASGGGCTTTTATISVNFNEQNRSIEDAEEMLNTLKDGVKKAAEEVGVKIKPSYENYSVNSSHSYNSFSQQTGNYNINGSMSFQVNNEKKAIELLKKIEALNFRPSLSVNRNHNSYGNCNN